jgi:hypothetical protein
MVSGLKFAQPAIWKTSWKLLYRLQAATGPAGYFEAGSNRLHKIRKIEA